MTTAAEKIVSPEGGATPVPSEAGEKHPVEKRRALGRGLDSLLPAVPVRREPAPAADGRDARRSIEQDDAHGAMGPTAGGPAAGEAPTTYVPQPGVIGDIQAQASRPAQGESVVQIPLEKIDPNPYQTRMEFDQEMLDDLRDSIIANGVVQPIVVRPGADGRYVLVLGERRCRASKMARKETIPAIVRRVSNQQAAEITVIENLQRQDLNCMEQASAFSKLSREFNLTQEQIGDRVGLSRESVSNYMRLLRLPGTVMEYLMHGQLSFAQARELLRLEDNETIASLADRVVEKDLSLAAVEDLVQELNMKRNLLPQPPKNGGGARWVDPNVRAAQAELARILGVRVKIRDRKGRGKIVIEYATLDDYERVVGMLRGSN